MCEDLEAGHIDLHLVKSVTSRSETIDLQTVSKRHILELDDSIDACLTICYGHNMADNRHLEFVLPPFVAQCVTRALQKLSRAVLILRRFHSDRRTQWLKEQYLQLYYENRRQHGPTPAEAIKVKYFALPRSITHQC